MTKEESEQLRYESERAADALTRNPFEFALLGAKISIIESHMDTGSEPPGESVDENGLTDRERKICVELSCDFADFARLKAARR